MQNYWRLCRHRHKRHSFAAHWVSNGGDIFRLSKVLGHHDVRIAASTYAHLAPEVWEQDYDRVTFHIPDAPAKVYELNRDDKGRIVGRDRVRLAPVG